MSTKPIIFQKIYVYNYYLVQKLINKSIYNIIYGLFHLTTIITKKVYLYIYNVKQKKKMINYYKNTTKKKNYIMYRFLFNIKVKNTIQIL